MTPPGASATPETTGGARGSLLARLRASTGPQEPAAPPTPAEVPVVAPARLPAASPRVAVDDEGRPTDRRLFGVPLPVGDDAEATQEQWLTVVELLMARGVKRPVEIGAVLGIPWRTAQTWMGEVRRRWGEALGAKNLETVRAELYASAEAAERLAFESLPEVTGKDRANLLKTAIEAGKRKAALVGADITRVETSTTTDVNVNVNGTVDVEVTHGLPPGALLAMGATIAQAMTAGRSPKPEPKVLTVEPVRPKEPEPPEPEG